MFIIYVFNTFCKELEKELEKEPKIFIDHSYKNVRIPYNEIIVTFYFIFL